VTSFKGFTGCKAMGPCPAMDENSQNSGHGDEEA